MFNPLLKKWVGKGELDYEVYLKTGTLLHLQTPSEELVHHDELLFQVTHQAQELWLKLISQEAVEVVAEMDGDLLWPSTGRLERMLRAMRCLVAEMNILETMTPDTYQIIRRSLGNGSGQESPGYNAMRLSADAMEAALERVLRRRNLRLVDVYKVGSFGAEDLKRICEQFVDLDELFQTWLYTHYQMVRRIIGVDRSIKALDGLPTQVLAGRMTLPLFRKLWEVRVEMTNAWRRDGGYAPGTQRASGTYPAVSPQAPASSGLIAEAVSAHASSAAPNPTPVVAFDEEPSPLAASAQALAAAAASVEMASPDSAPPAARHPPGMHAHPPVNSHPPASAHPPVSAHPPTSAHPPANAHPPVNAAPAPSVAPPAAPVEDPWSKPEPPRRGHIASTPTPAPIPAPTAEPNDPWSKPEPPTSRRAAQLQEDASAASAGAQWNRPPKDQGPY
ncbi:tryptophan 2,3-dioxygenase family protein [Hyalangium versicolor]|uniref:tryptophan 2,3-dioxygenase family protein n=1 Tax=Hyalangium versicolor TaxID=2861190 RepID=UPI001CCA5CF5|nr:tryptophan 2,3-dioxygenase family protein [Hyalangium versicolor]